MGLHDTKHETKLEKKVKEKYPDFYESTMSMNREALNLRINQTAKAQADMGLKKLNDADLEDAATHYNNLKKPYADAKKASEDQISFMRNRLREIGEE